MFQVCSIAFHRALDYGKDAKGEQGKHLWQIKYLESLRVARCACLAQNARMPDARSSPSAAPYPLAVIMERVRLADRWATDHWEAKDIVRDLSPPGSTERVILEDERTTQVLFPSMPLRLQAAEAEGYLLNLTSPEPRVFVLWRMDGEIARPERLTVSYNEGTRWADSDEHVDSVPLPEDLVPWITEFAVAHYRPEPKKKPRYASSKDKGVASRRQG
jgi:hypothetical protein